MHYDIHLRKEVQNQLKVLAETMRTWEAQPRISEELEKTLRERINCFDHATHHDNLCLGGADGSGDFPALSYADSFIYFTLAQGTVYQASPASGLKEVGPLLPPVMRFTWLPEEQSARHAALDETFSYLAGCDLREVIEHSDYRYLKSSHADDTSTLSESLDGLIRPHAADAGNIGIQLRSVAELGAALRLIRREPKSHYVLLDGTLSLPMVTRRGISLFHEHLKRLCCVEARARGTGFLALSKSHGLPSIDTLEQLAREKMGTSGIAEHWYLRLPVSSIDDWAFPLTQERLIPPPGAVTYLFRLHRNIPVMRLDMDREHWTRQVLASTEDKTQANERRLFQDLDYASHDQRSYGYPYPIKAGHDRASLTKPERVALRKQIINAALKAGMKRSLFRDASRATGHA